MKGDVKKRILSPPLAGNQSVVTYIQPCLLPLEGLLMLILPLWIAA